MSLCFTLDTCEVGMPTPITVTLSDLLSSYCFCQRSFIAVHWCSCKRGVLSGCLSWTASVIANDSGLWKQQFNIVIIGRELLFNLSDWRGFLMAFTLFGTAEDDQIEQECKSWKLTELGWASIRALELWNGSNTRLGFRRQSMLHLELSSNSYQRWFSFNRLIN